ncbi:Na/Pi cotransporter family protein [Magnetococcales bacterium HHB-1]
MRSKSKEKKWRRGVMGRIGVISGGILFYPSLGYAVGEQTTSVDFFTLVVHLLGGLAVFLYGMNKMSRALRKVAGDRMRDLLARLTSNRVAGLFTGLSVTAVIQSSSVTTVMLVGFVSAGLMNLTQAVGVILGADIGTTVTAQIIAFKVTQYAGLAIAGGLLLMMLARTKNVRQYGHLFLGLGLIFLGMAEMSDAMYPLRSYAPFLALMSDVANPFVGVMVSALFTALIQSSSAAMGVVVVLASQGVLSLEGAIALALGANIGTCITAGLAAIGQPREAVRVALAHVLFKVAGVLLIIGFIPEFAQITRDISPVAEEGLIGHAALAAEVPRQVANAHTLFNIGIALLFLPVVGWFARFCIWLLPDSAVQDHPRTMKTPVTARTVWQFTTTFRCDKPWMASWRFYDPSRRMLYSK